jgi:hypothetical protein
MVMWVRNKTDRHGKAKGHYSQILMIIAGCKEPLRVVRVSAVASHIGTIEGAGSAAWTAGTGMCHLLAHRLIGH